MADLVVGATVTVSGGKYDGRTGRVTSVAEKSCKLSIDDAETGSIKKAQLAVAIGSVLGAGSQPPRLMRLMLLQMLLLARMGPARARTLWRSVRWSR
jgi:hypothetical protein